MKTFEIEYTTNLDDRITDVVEAPDFTKAYLKFTLEHPEHYIITDLKEV